MSRIYCNPTSTETRNTQRERMCDGHLSLQTGAGNNFVRSSHQRDADRKAEKKYIKKKNYDEEEDHLGRMEHA